MLHSFKARVLQALKARLCSPHLVAIVQDGHAVPVGQQPLGQVQAQKGVAAALGVHDERRVGTHQHLSQGTGTNTSGLKQEGVRARPGGGTAGSRELKGCLGRRGAL